MRDSACTAGRLGVVAIEHVRTPAVPFVRSLSASPAVRHGVRVQWTVSGRTRPGGTVSERLSDRGVHGGRRTPPRGHRTGTRLAEVPALTTGAGVTPDRSRCWERLGVPKGASAVPSCPVRARTCRPCGWPWPADRTHGRTLGAGGVRWPPPSGRGPDPSAWRSHGPGVSGRPDGREVRHVRHPTSHCRVSAGGTGRRRRCPDGCPAAVPWRTRASSLTAGMSGMPWRGPQGAYPGGPGFGAGRRAVPARKPATPSIGPTDEGAGGWVSGSRQATSVCRRWRAGQGSARRRVVPGGVIGSWRANRSAVEPASRIQRTYLFSKPDLKFCPFIRPY
jgi:hypothetical protein